ncbi:CTP synthase C-terminal region-related (seleno)protein [Allokutzneria albata]|uniref:CTP synthase (glutamine hydrolyzing) n=1 Tax=Allokutzneria albata TaxID=211114 RepID=A0A1G9SAU0_ALLAB|nr:hypothetical protein [Allokutzneria albata]SDM32539.1 Glutamine amidotransferase class-I [Allokutzneria albata]
MSNAPTTIAVIGDHHPGYAPHETITDALRHVDAQHGTRTVSRWIATPDAQTLTTTDLAAYDGFWIAPGSPYRSIDGALRVIEHARLHDRPLLGTCGGFQHLVLEFARNVLGITDAAHAEYDPYASRLFVRALTCSLAGLTLEVRVLPNTLAARLYNDARAAETYHCDFGLAPEHIPQLQAGGLTVSGVDDTGEPRIIELPGRRFFLGTLFVPQTTSTAQRPHPLVEGFVRACST